MAVDDWLDTKWQTPLPDAGNNVTSVIANSKQGRVYAGSYGYVYSLDYSGERKATNVLKGLGRNEVRLAMPHDGSILLVGTHGTILGLDPTSLETKWQTGLPDSDSQVVSVLSANQLAYAGSNGYVYLIDQSSGRRLHTNDLSGLGNHEVRLGISLDFSVLFVGTYDPTNLTMKWKNNLPNCGYEVTSVVGGDKVGYAGCTGMVYLLEADKGVVITYNNLAGTGKEEVRLALDDNASHLYVGTNGFAIGLRPDNIATVYSTPLPNSASSIISVEAGDDTAFFAGKGYVYQVNLKGTIVAHNSLDGRGHEEVRLAVDQSASKELFVGTNGYALGLAMQDYPGITGAWMKQKQFIIGRKELRRVALPGTHDSGTSTLTEYSAIGADDLSWIKSVEGGISRWLINTTIAKWAKAQTADFSAQLASGIRYFDLRVQGTGGSLNFVHGLVGPPVTDLISQLDKFLSQAGNDKEVVFLDFNHFYDMTPDLHDNLVLKLKTAFGNKLAPPSVGADVTLNDLWKTNYRIITIYHDDTTMLKYPFLWPGWYIASPWPNKQDTASLREALKSYLPNTRTTFFVLQGIITPTFTDNILRGFIPFSNNPDSLATQAGALNPNLVTWLANDWKDKGINIVICDWYSISPKFIDTVVGLNDTQTD